MKCHYIYDKQVGKILIPGCMGTAVYGVERCTCRNESHSPKNEKDVLIKELEKENARLNRVLRRVNGYK